MNNQEFRLTLRQKASDPFRFLVLALIVAGLPSCLGPPPGPGAGFDNQGHMGTLEPVSTCFDFQGSATTTNLETTFKLSAATIHATPGALIVARSAPYKAHAWVPNPVHYLEARNGHGQRSLVITFAKPVKWAKVSMAIATTDELKKPSLKARLVNSKGNVGEWIDHTYGTTVASMVFGSNDKVILGRSLVPAGDIQKIEMSSPNSNIDLWQVCYWP